MSRGTEKILTTVRGLRMPNNTDTAGETRIYVEVFQIPHAECPPDYFTLFQLDRDCTDPARIEIAAKKRASLLNKSLPAELHLPARKVLRRMERAKVCLLDPQSRAAYLAKLTGRTVQLESHAHLERSMHRTSPSSPYSARESDRSGAMQNESGLRHQSPTAKRHKGPSTRESVLDLGPTTALNAYPTNKTNNAGPVLAIGGVVGVLAICLIIFGLTRNTQTPAPDESITSLPSNRPQEASQETPLSLDPATQELAAIEQQPVTDSPAAPLASPGPPNAEPFAVAVKNTPNIEEAAPALPDKPDDQASPSAHSQELSLAAFEKEIELPQLSDSKTEVSAGDDEKIEIVKLGALSDITYQNLQLGIAQPTVSRFTGTEFYVREETDEQTARIWEIRLKKEAEQSKDSALDKLAAGFDKLIATIGFEEGYLKFAWVKVEERNFAEQLRNCILLLRSGAEQAKIQLRPVKNVGQFLTDLTERNLLFDLDDVALPAVEAIQLRIHDINLAGVKFEVKPPHGTAKYGDSIEIKLLDWKGDASLRFSLVGEKEQPTVRFTPRYRIGRKRNSPLTSAELRSAIENARKALADGKDRLEFAQQQERRLPSEIKQVWARDDGSNSAQVKAMASKLTRQLRSAEGTIKRMDRSIPEMEATIAILEELASVARRFDQTGSIAFEVIVPCNDEELVLLSTSSI